MTENREHTVHKKHRQANFPPSSPAWMVTYSDLVTLLLTFFVLLLSMANMDPVRFTKASSSLKDAFGIQREPAQVDFSIPAIPSPPVTRFSPIRQQTTEKVYEKIKSQIDSLRLNDRVGLVKRDAESILLRINDSVLFAPGQAHVSRDAYPLLRLIGDLLQPLPMELRIEGHTDDRPFAGAKMGNWNLSVERSISVLRFFAENKLLPLDRMSAIGYGQDRPLKPNTDEASRALNRRVDFVLRLQSYIGADKNGRRNEGFPL